MEHLNKLGCGRSGSGVSACAWENGNPFWGMVQGESDALVEDEEYIPESPSLKKLKRYSGLFVMLKQKGPLSEGQKAAVLQTALATFRRFIYPNIRSFV